MKRLLSVLFWSVIAAAFIGPGTVTTAASAGASHGTALLWTLGFSTLACLVLQEAAGRLRLLSGHSLGGALGVQFPRGIGRWLVLVLVVGAVLVGNAAYEAGNILGGVAGASLLLDWPGWVLTILCGTVVASLLWFNAPRRVAQILGGTVAVMGVAFLFMAAALRPAAGPFLHGLLVPSLPVGSGLLALGLVGTTVVPYNLFLGSGLAQDQELPVFRFGLAVAVVLGGIISMGIMIVGTMVVAPFGFETLTEALEARFGGWASGLFALGLTGAGLSSAITAPLAAALTARSLFGDVSGSDSWSVRGARYRAVWGSVLLVGVAFGLSGVRPVPAIILAQALNGVVLPGVALFLLIAVNDRGLMGDGGLNGWFSNGLMMIVVLVTVLLGVAALGRVVSAVSGVAAPPLAVTMSATALIALGGLVPLARLMRGRRGE